MLVGVRVIFFRKFGGGFRGAEPLGKFWRFYLGFQMKKCTIFNSFLFYFILYITPLHCLIYSLTKVRNQSLNFCFLWYFLARAKDNFLLTFSRNQSIFHHQKFNNISSWLATKWRNLFVLKVISRRTFKIHLVGTWNDPRTRLGNRGLPGRPLPRCGTTGCWNRSRWSWVRARSLRLKTDQNDRKKYTKQVFR